MSASLLVVLYEGAGAAPLDADARFEITRTLLEKGYRVTSARQGRRSDAPADRQLLVLGRFDTPPPAEAVVGDRRRGSFPLARPRSPPPTC